MAFLKQGNNLGNLTLGALFPLVLGLGWFGTANAQQPVVAKAVRSTLTPVFQGEPPAPPAPPQGSGGSTRDDLFAGTEKFAKGAKDVTEVDMDPDTLSLVGGSAAKKAHDVVLRVVKTYSYDKPGMYNPADVEEYRRKLETGDWHCSVHTRDGKGEATDICSRRRAPDMIESAIITMEPRELTFIHTIKRANGQGSGVDVGSMPDVYMHLSPEVLMAMVQPEVMADVAAATAEMKARSAEWMSGLNDFKFSMPDINLDLKLKDLDMQKFQDDMQKFQEQMKNFKPDWKPQPDKQN